jgi:hypothetical protein
LRGLDPLKTGEPLDGICGAPGAPHIAVMPDAPSPNPCPICGKPAERKFRPFCSGRCADLDLHRWLAGVYVVPANEDDDEAERPQDGGAPRP